VPEQRKTVTILFCDLSGSTALGESIDPERLRTLLATYFEQMRAIVEHHGGSVEKFIGDAVMAVFGVPVAHEDDALRAVRAALEMRDALPGLGFEGRVGVMTGEVVTGTEERLATGDAVNVAARLEQAAAAGDVLIGEPTLALVHDAVDVDPVEWLSVKGKSEPIAAHRLLRVRDALGRRHEEPFVGRESELGLLRDAWDRARLERRCELVTIVGEAGVGKSRLAAELLGSIDETVVRGRCLPYGDGITYWAIVEVLKQLDLVPDDDAAAAAIRSLLGESDAATSPEEIAWAFRKTLEQAAAERPLVVVLDDIQWGDETLHNLIEHVGLLSTVAPILLICMARPELAENRPTWPVTLRLGLLGDDDVEMLLADRVPQALRKRITRAAGGNPLFVEEMVAIARETDGDVAVPPTLQALLAARLDQLDPAERRVLERGAIEGEMFHRGAVQALAPEEREVTPRLAALVRKQLIRPEPTLLPGEDGFRFRHLLIRDAAYDGLPKSVRAALHAGYAAWLDQHDTHFAERDEVLGYHLERAWGYRTELGLEEDRELAATARRRLAAAGRRAAVRKDFVAAAGLLERAVGLIPPNDVDVALELQLARALYESGRGRDALERSESLADRSGAHGIRIGELAGTVQAAFIRLDVEPDGAIEKLNALVAKMLPELQAIGNDHALYTAHHALGMVAFSRAKGDAATEAWERATAHAERAGIPDELLGWRALSRLYGSTPVTEVLAWLDEHEPRERHDYWLRASRGVALAMLGRFDEGRAILAETRVGLEERGGALQLAIVTGIESVIAELLAGDPGAAAELGAEGCRLLDELDAQSFLSTAAGALARALCELDRLDEADAWARRSADVGDTEDLFTQPLWRATRAKILSRRGEHADAVRLAREAVAITESTDDVNGQADAYRDLAEVLLLGGERERALDALFQALERYERKENVVSAARARAKLTALRATPPSAG
jgi:class 3 adenylate cyclase/tetratricopeptide (TPR) repeat protein